MRCECFIILKLIWHRYLVFSLNNRAYKISTEISLRIIRISKRTSTKKTDDQVQTNQRDYISSKLDQVLNNHHLSRSSASGPGIILQRLHTSGRGSIIGCSANGWMMSTETSGGFPLQLPRTAACSCTCAGFTARVW